MEGCDLIWGELLSENNQRHIFLKPCGTGELTIKM